MIGINMEMPKSCKGYKFKTHLTYEHWMCNVDESVRMYDDTIEFKIDRPPNCPLLEIEDKEK